MPGTPTTGGARWLVAAGLLLGLLPAPLCAEWKAGEYRVASYVIDASAIDTRYEEGGKALRLAAPPIASRFFAADAELWDLSASFREARVLRDPHAWAIINATTQRLVVRATEEDHLRVEIMWRNFYLPRHPALRAELIRVSCAELGAVDWSAAELRKREAESLLKFEGGAEFGEEIIMTAKGITVQGTLTARINYAGSGVLELSYFLEVTLTRNGAQLPLNHGTSLPVQGGLPLYLDLGSPDDPGTTLLLVLEGEVQFSDGTPMHRGIEFERAEDQPPIPELPSSIGLDHKRELQSGQVFAIWGVPPTYLLDLELEPDGAEDPFGAREADAETRQQEALEKLPAVYQTDKVPGMVGAETLRDMAEPLRRRGIALPPGAWAWFSSTSSRLIGKIDPDTFELIDQLNEVLGSGIPSWTFRVSASLLEWEGERVGNEIPAGAVRRGRIGMQGSQGRLLRSTLGESVEEELVRGVRIECEPSINFEGVLSLRLELQFSPPGVRIEQNLDLTPRVPVLMPVGKRDGKELGVLLEVSQVNLDGTVRN